MTANATTPRLWGRHEHFLDDKCRFVVPMRLRESLGAEFVLCPGPGKHIRAYPLAVWETLENELTAGGLEMELNPDRVLLQRLYGNCDFISRDAENRVTIPGHLREWAQLGPKHPMAIIGTGTRLELWNPTLLKQYTDIAFADTAQIAAAAARLSGSPSPQTVMATETPIATLAVVSSGESVPTAPA